MKASIKISILFLSVAVFMMSSSRAFARTYTSPAFTLQNARIVFAGGKASSQNYLLRNVGIGNAFGSKAQSENYSLDLSRNGNDRALLPQPPTLNPVTTPTNIATQTLSG